MVEIINNASSEVKLINFLESYKTVTVIKMGYMDYMVIALCILAI